MPELVQSSSHKLCSVSIQRYLERGERALDLDFFNVPERHQEKWAAWFDAIRQAAGNDTPVRGHEAVTYQHFVISPDPRDEVDLATLQMLVVDWYCENFLSEDGIGNYPAVAVYHDDNENQIAHAHIIVNNTIPGLRKHRLHISDAQTRKLGDSLQRLAYQYDLSYFPTFDRKLEEEELDGKPHPVVKIGEKRPNVPLPRMHRPERLTRAEIGLLDRKVIPWKERMRDAIDIAIARSLNGSEFEEALALMGVVREKRAEAEDIFAMESNPAYRVRGITLGDDYSDEGIASRLSSMRIDWNGSSEEIRRLRQKAENIINDRDTLWSIYVNAEGVSDELLESGLEAHEIAEMERVNNTEHIVAFEDYDPAIAALERRAVDAREDGLRWDAKVFSKRAEDLKAAKKTASICGAFTNVDDSTNATLHRNKSSKALYREQFQTKET